MLCIKILEGGEGVVKFYVFIVYNKGLIIYDIFVFVLLNV